MICILKSLETRDKRAVTRLPRSIILQRIRRKLRTVLIVVGDIQVLYISLFIYFHVILRTHCFSGNTLSLEKKTRRGTERRGIKKVWYHHDIAQIHICIFIRVELEHIYICQNNVSSAIGKKETFFNNISCHTCNCGLADTTVYRSRGLSPCLK